MKMDLIVSMTVLLFFNSGYSQSIDTFITDSIIVNAENVPVNPNQAYFPKTKFPQYGFEATLDGMIAVLIEGEYNDSRISWYSDHLFRMQEPLLFNRKTQKEIFRFTWLRTFDRPIAIRIEKHEDDYWLYWKQLSGKGGYDPGKLIRNRKKKISQEDWDVFLKKIGKFNFWRMKNPKPIFGNDGSQWILEGANANEYHVVDVWSPNKGDFYDACSYLIALTNLKVKEKDKY